MFSPEISCTRAQAVIFLYRDMVSESPAYFSITRQGATCKRCSLSIYFDTKYQQEQTELGAEIQA